jgi:phosphoglycolate phosphatase-like HAD superfamily hydrolase
MLPNADGAGLLDLSSVAAVLFDMDRTLVDSDASVKRAAPGTIRGIFVL